MTSQFFDWRIISFLTLAWVMSPSMKFPAGLLCKNVFCAGSQMSFDTIFSKPDFSKPVLKPPHPEKRSIDLGFFIWITCNWLLSYCHIVSNLKKMFNTIKFFLFSTYYFFIKITSTFLLVVCSCKIVLDFDYIDLFIFY